MLSVRDLRKRYGDLIALDGVSFEVKQGDIVGFLGPNGAGKSTTMKIVTGFIPATSGTAVIDGFDVRTHSLEARRRLGYLPENTPLYPEMRVREYLEFRAQLKGIHRRDLAKRVDYALDRTKLLDRKRQLIGTLSKGYRQRVGIADALVGDPKLLILDEPTIGLDPNQIREVRTLIKELGQQHTIVLSTHILSEVEMVCSKVVIIARGRSVEQGTVRELVEKHHENVVRVAVRGPGATLDEVERALSSVPGVKGAREQLRKAGEPGAASSEARPDEPELVRFRLDVADDGADADRAMHEVAERVAARVLEKGWALRELVPEKTTLEDVFVRVTLREPAPEAARPLEPQTAGAGEVRS